MMLQQEQPEDFVIATGVQYSVREFVQQASAELGVHVRFEGEGVDEVGIVDRVEGRETKLKPGQVIVRVDPRYFRPTEVETLLGDPSKAHAKARLEARDNVFVPREGDGARGFPDRASRCARHAGGLQGSRTSRVRDMDKNARIFVAGHRGMVGSALVRRLERAGYCNIVTRTRAHLDLTDQGGVNLFFEEAHIDVVLLAAARVGGIHANSTMPASFIYENLAIETNVIHAASRWNVSKLVFFGSSCIYPKACPQPIKEEYLLTVRARADQRGLCDREDRGPEDVRGLQPAVRHEVRLADADQSLRPERQLRPAKQPCAARADPQGA